LAEKAARHVGSSSSIGVAFPASNPEEFLSDTLQFRSNYRGGKQTVEGADYVGTINRQNIVAGEEVASFALNPLAFPGTSLALAAQRFKRWDIPAVGDFVMWFNSAEPTTSPGQLIGFWEPDVYAPVLAGEDALRRAFSTVGEKPTQVWENQAWPWIGPLDHDHTSMYINPGHVDLRFSTPGRFKLVAASDIPSVVGTMHIVYKMDMFLHELEPNLIGSVGTHRAWNFAMSAQPQDHHDFFGVDNINYVPGSESEQGDSNSIPLAFVLSQGMEWDYAPAPSQGNVTVCYFGIKRGTSETSILNGTATSFLPVGTVLQIELTSYCNDAWNNLSNPYTAEVDLSWGDMTEIPKASGSAGVPPGPAAPGQSTVCSTNIAVFSMAEQKRWNVGFMNNTRTWVWNSLAVVTGAQPRIGVLGGFTKPAIENNVARMTSIIVQVVDPLGVGRGLVDHYNLSNSALASSSVQSTNPIVQQIFAPDRDARREKARMDALLRPLTSRLEKAIKLEEGWRK
jgi:hypothetical protein